MNIVKRMSLLGHELTYPPLTLPHRERPEAGGYLRPAGVLSPANRCCPATVIDAKNMTIIGLVVNRKMKKLVTDLVGKRLIPQTQGERGKNQICYHQ
jgi:hypothetical protein